MKKILYILFASAVMILTASCTDDTSSNDGKSAVTFSLSGIATRADDAANSTNGEQALIDAVMPKLSFRIYSIVSNKETFIRMYSGEEIKDKQIWLVPGKYKVVVDGGDQSPATFERSEVYYHGEQEFTIKENMDNRVVVQCYPQNVMIKIRYDKSVKDLVVSGGLTGVSTLVAVTDNVEEIGSSASLTYDLSIEDVLNDDGEATGDKILKEPTLGYYTFSEEQKSIVWKFQATDANKNKKIEKQNVYTPKDPTTNEPIGFKPGYVYTLTLKYSPDLGGYISLQVSASKKETAYDDIVEFRPAPQFSGTYVNKPAAVYKDMEGGLEYMVKAINPMESIDVYIGSDVVTSGVGINEVNEKEWKLTLNGEFIKLLGAGDQRFRVVAKDVNGAETEYVQYYKGEGAYEMEVTNAWFGEAKLKAYVNNPSVTDGTIFYRKKGTADWSSVALTIANGIGSADISGIIGNAAYEFYLSYGDDVQDKTAIGPTKEETKATIANPIPNGDMEEWSFGEKIECPSPYTNQNESKTWDTGNHGSTTVGTNITTRANEPRFNSTGKYSAKLDSEYIVVKFASGNIFYGRYYKTDGTSGGTVDFGQSFDFDYKPTKLTVWYKGTPGVVNHAGGDLALGGSDKSQIYIWLYDNNDAALKAKDTGGRYRVSTSDQNTFVTPDGKYVKTGNQVEGLIAYGYWNRTQTKTEINGAEVSIEYDDAEKNGWTKIEIPLVYVNDKKPTALVISCAASAYGDYFAGSTDTFMYVDDFEFEYDN